MLNSTEAFSREPNGGNVYSVVQIRYTVNLEGSEILVPVHRMIKLNSPTFKVDLNGTEVGFHIRW